MILVWVGEGFFLLLLIFEFECWGGEICVWGLGFGDNGWWFLVLLMGVLLIDLLLLFWMWLLVLFIICLWFWFNLVGLLVGIMGGDCCLEDDFWFGDGGWE